MPDLKSFHEQVKRGDLQGVRDAIEGDPALLNGTNDSGQSAFLLAKYYGQGAVAEYLLSLRPELDLFNKCVAGLTSDVLAEIDRDPSLLEVHNSDGWTPLHLAAFFGHPELAKALLNRGAHVDVRSTNAMTNTPLHAGVAGRKAEVIRVLIDRGANVNARQHGGWTALQGAAQSGDRAIVELLLAHGADPNLRAENNQSALDLALLKGHQEIATLLEELGAKLQ
ncbi:MAG: Ankyrin [Bryobacterales bacterium]|jgi:ankyrin repeat protein|nr:Ankyrin [Bryobacterales bacterium]